MIYEVEGDIMLSRAKLIVQGVATNDLMTRGLARKLGQRYPAMVKDFHAYCEQEQPQPGQVWLWGETGTTQIMNLITHESDADIPARVGRPNKISVNRAFRALNTLYNEHRFKSIAMPKIGAGEFGLDWAEVKDMLHAQLGQLLIPIFVYTKELDGQVAHEPGL